MTLDIPPDWTSEISQAYATRNALLIADMIVNGADMPKIAVVLGTGWGESLQHALVRQMPFTALEGFEALGVLKDHARLVAYGTMDGTPIIALRGRVHMFEHPNHWLIAFSVRQQIEMLAALGVTTVILTAAVGGLDDDVVKPGTFVFAKEFITAYTGGPFTPLLEQEHRSPMNALKLDVLTKACDAVVEDGHHALLGTHVFYRGPQYETPADKRIMRQGGGHVVGMSITPEMLACARFGLTGIPVTCVSNTAAELHSAEEIARRMRARSALLGDVITRIVDTITR